MYITRSLSHICTYAHRYLQLVHTLEDFTYKLMEKGREENIYFYWDMFSEPNMRMPKKGSSKKEARESDE